MPTYPNLKAFIVHGHDHGFRDAVKEHFESNLGFEQAVVLDAVASAGLTLIEKFELESSRCNVAVILLTPDDEAKTGTGVSYRTARPNVWFELGYFSAFLGRKTGRILLLYKDGLDMPSDLEGIVYINATAGLTDENVARKIEVELNALVQHPQLEVGVDRASANSLLNTDLQLEGIVRLRSQGAV